MTFRKRGITIIKCDKSDKETIKNLELKFGDQIEISRLSGMSPKEYLEWHVDNYLEYTHLLIHEDSNVFGIIGIDPSDKILFLLTEDIPLDIKSNFVRYFREVLESLMDEYRLNECLIFIDKNYAKSYKWASRYGFKHFESVIIDDFEAELMKYTKS